VLCFGGSGGNSSENNRRLPECTMDVNESRRCAELRNLKCRRNAVSKFEGKCWRGKDFVLRLVLVLFCWLFLEFEMSDGSGESGLHFGICKL
jgi:hypothetical protein